MEVCKLILWDVREEGRLANPAAQAVAVAVPSGFDLDGFHAV
jgi:hypothetical protein